MIFITGASSGIGEACARAFAQRKQSLLLVARRLEKLQALRTELTKEYGVEVVALELDVTSRGEVEAFGRENAAMLARVTVLVNNAGLAKGLDTIQDGKTDDWEVMIDTNVKGLLYVTRMVLPHFVSRKSGQVINLGSIAGRWMYPKGNVYCATKSAVHALSESMRLDLHGLGIRVSEISPGMVETDFSLVRFDDAAKADAVYKGASPLSAADVAETVVWVAERPAHVNVQEVVLYPTAQASPGLVDRR
jgi:3-hydroxy acid dehydrogenase/malonic semialdehyde reductase